MLYFYTSSSLVWGSVSVQLFLCLCFTPVTGPLIYMFTTCFAKFCHLCVTLYCRPARLCASYLRNNLVVCSTREEVCSCVRAEKEFGRVLDLIESLVVCSTRERVWSCVRPEREFGHVFDPRESLVVCSTRERVWSCVRPEREFGRVFDPRKSFVVCCTRERVWSCSTRERVST